MDSATLFRRHSGNPLLHSANVPFDARLVFNPGVVRFRGKYLMVFRYEYGSFNGKLLANTRLGTAWSLDGLSWETAGDLTLSLNDPDVSRVYDPRLTVLENKLYLNFAADTGHGIRAGLAVANSALAFQILDMSTPDNRNHVLFPEKIGGYYWRLERPFPMYGRGGRERFDIWISRSPDLVHWGGAQLLLALEDVPWANAKIGPGAPPIKTEEGWLIFFHAVDVDDTRGKNGWEDRWTKRYTVGVALLDSERPWEVIKTSREPVLVPQAGYETREGFRTNVVFPGAAILEPDGTIKLYYGASDTAVCLAEAHRDDIMAFLS